MVVELIRNGISVEVETPGRRRTPDASLLLAIGRTRPGSDLREKKATYLQLDAIKTQRNEGRLAIFLNPCNADTWNLRQMRALKNTTDISEARYQVRKDGNTRNFKLLHNLPARSFSILGSQSFQSWARRIQVLTLCVKAGLAHWEPLQFPMGEEEQQAWVLDCLLHSTRGFSKPGVAANISNEVQKLLKTVSAGKES